MRIFISGGCKNGKSYYSQHLANTQRTNTPMYYVATMKSTDYEDDERIVKHQKERDGWGFLTIEQSNDIEKILYDCDTNGSFLLDSTTALLANEMFLPNGSINENASQKICTGLSRLINNIKNIVIVSDYIYSDAMIYDSLTEKYRKSLANIDTMLAENCDIVLEAVYTNIIVHKGKEIFCEIHKKIF